MAEIVTRNPNWTEAEITALVESVKDNQAVIKAKFTSDVTMDTKKYLDNCHVKVIVIYVLTRLHPAIFPLF